MSTRVADSHKPRGDLRHDIHIEQQLHASASARATMRSSMAQAA
jgi:hypothetical protein